MSVVSYRFLGTIWTGLLIASCMAACAAEPASPRGDGDGADAGGDTTPAVTPGVAPTGMNYIPAGSFTMGSPANEVGRPHWDWADETQHSVTISRSFFINQTEVTQGQWKSLSGGINPSYFQDTTCSDNCASDLNCAQYNCASDANANDSGPVEDLDWYAAVGFANAKSAAEGLTSCYTLTGCIDAANGWQDGFHEGCTDAIFAGLTCTGYRLPTESEWEYAARAGTTAATYGGNLSAFNGCATLSGAGSFAAGTGLENLAWFSCNAGRRTQAVGGKSANSFGLYDMLGNVSEWTGDWFSETYPGTVTDPLGAVTGADRVIRGGAWDDGAASARAAQRFNFAADFRYRTLGFRLARTAP